MKKPHGVNTLQLKIVRLQGVTRNPALRLAAIFMILSPYSKDYSAVFQSVFFQVRLYPLSGSSKPASSSYLTQLSLVAELPRSATSLAFWPVSLKKKLSLYGGKPILPLPNGPSRHLPSQAICSPRQRDGKGQMELFRKYSIELNSMG
ncbi:MAG: hypothetical protein K6U11_02685 [bacterium]|nr:hypothetical protein [bacterium]